MNRSRSNNRRSRARQTTPDTTGQAAPHTENRAWPKDGSRGRIGVGILFVFLIIATTGACFWHAPALVHEAPGPAPSPDSITAGEPDRSPAGTGGDFGLLPLPSTVRRPGEFEPHDAVMLSAAQMIQFHPQALVDIVAACHDRLDVLCLVGYEQEKQLVMEQLHTAGLPADAVIYVTLPLTSMWVRDYGPISVVDAHQNLHFVDFQYAAPESDPHDDDVPLHLSRGLHVPAHRAELILEGGDLIGNGRGLILGSKRIIDKNAAKYGYDRQEIAQLLGENLGCTEWAPLPPLVGEPTGHVDMFVTFVGPGTVVVGKYDPAVDEVNADRLDRIAEALARLTCDGRPLRVERIPMPAHTDGLWRTYTNVAFVNGRLLVPVYPDAAPDLDRQALAIYASLMPDWEIVPIDASTLIRRKGALHCVTLNLPSYDSGLVRRHALP